MDGDVLTQRTHEVEVAHGHRRSHDEGGARRDRRGDVPHDPRLAQSGEVARGRDAGDAVGRRPGRPPRRVGLVPPVTQPGQERRDGRCDLGPHQGRVLGVSGPPAAVRVEGDLRGDRDELHEFAGDGRAPQAQQQPRVVRGGPVGAAEQQAAVVEDAVPGDPDVRLGHDRPAQRPGQRRHVARRRTDAPADDDQAVRLAEEGVQEVVEHVVGAVDGRAGRACARRRSPGRSARGTGR